MQRDWILSIALHMLIVVIIYGYQLYIKSNASLIPQPIAISLVQQAPSSYPTPVPVKRKQPEKKITPKPKPKKVTPIEPVKKKSESVIPKPKVTPRKKPQPPKIKERAELDFDSVLKSIADIEAQNQKPKDQEDAFEELTKDLTLESVDQNQNRSPAAITDSERSQIRRQIMRHWTILSGAMDARDLSLRLRISLLPNGEVEQVYIVDQERYQADRVFKAMVDSAIRAVYKSSPISGLPKETYDSEGGWKTLELHFDPRELF